MRLRLSIGNAIGLGLLALVSAVGSPRAAASGGHPLRVDHGVLTVDGMTAGTDVDLRISSLRYLYIALPGAGTAIVAEHAFPGAHEQKAAFRGSLLSVQAGGSHVQLTAANRMRGTRSAYVRFEAGAGAGVSKPTVSYGDAALVPAVWPEEAVPAHNLRLRVRVRGHRALRSAKLCRPSRHGRELCATIHEVVYHPQRER